MGNDTARIGYGLEMTLIMYLPKVVDANDDSSQDEGSLGLLVFDTVLNIMRNGERCNI